ncbi:hypothetical protein PTSG_08182 [Salpingoeca rosetta]|uniref:J domain-containing protein n=1 Tax=Salpingoeca rosetta (strain ATCC 50818 / BSB-021) TaxID=946362 RepID=F2UI86_SALR5|nr:uncharacterized protein PTSG_08182 [Salpingoeca rosetta]EGD76835.1 hypothetical protein PTSG_08182 [Salpingoeca rosetta]|eukprot:XP_004991207.1 hypothetical protein PTSG_08182 [Salpingoeca rosetta]
MPVQSYYDTLGLQRSALPADVRKAYRKLSLENHPDRNKSIDAEANFKRVAEAYVVLSTPDLRAIYDQYGMEGLSSGAPKGHDGYTDPWVFDGDAHKVFREFFGTDNPFQDLFPPQDEFQLGPGPSVAQRLRRHQSPPIESDLYISLEEAFTGCVKKLRITRKVLNDDGHTTTQRDKILTVNVKPGWKEGTRVTFPKEGDQGPNNIPADVVFVIKYRDHPRFRRKGNDLIHTTRVKLSDALCGCGISLLTLDGRQLNIPVNDVITPAYMKRVPGEGMPHSKDPATRGDLIIKFDILFPANLTDDSKRLIRAALP